MQTRPDAPTGGNPIEAQVTRIFETHAPLRDIYLLFGDPYSGGDRTTLHSKLSFLLWYAVFGRHKYEAICNLDPTYMALLATPLASGSTLLGYYLGELTAKPATVAEPTAALHVATARTLFAPILKSGVFSPGGLGDGIEAQGVSIVGFPLSTVGIGEDVRCLHKVLTSLGIPVNLVNVGPEQLEQITEISDYEASVSSRPVFSTVIFCIPFFEYVRVMAQWGPYALAGRTRIGYFAWELTEVDPCWHETVQSFDEIWSSSHFTFDVFRKIRANGVHYMPMLVDTPEPDRSVKARYELPTDFSCLIFIDFMSTLKRKNAIGAVTAFRRAFADGGLPASLVIKAMHVDFHAAAWEELLAVIGDDPRIVVIEGPLSRAETLGLVATSDVFISLHRAEGFGRVLAEAMALGTIVVATDWSGSRDIVRADTGFPVRCTLVPVGAADYYEAAGLWAEPDLDHAAGVLRALRAHPERSSAIVEQARSHVLRSFSLTPVRARVAARIQALGRRSERRPA